MVNNVDDIGGGKHKPNSSAQTLANTPMTNYLFWGLCLLELWNKY
jgi:hypothetical protein